MGRQIKHVLVFAVLVLSLSACAERAAEATVDKPVAVAEPIKATPIPPTLAEIADKKNTKTESSLGEFDFKNFTYPLPRGWQDVDSKEVSLENGERRLTEDKIGMLYVTTKFGDVTGDGEDEAIVFLRVRTGGAATPHIVYIFELTDENPEIIWYFRTGDRADGGLKRVYAEDGNLVVELFGQDRYIFNQMETLRIIGDEPQLCCPADFTKNIYKRVSNGFQLEGDRLTYSLNNSESPPRANLGYTKLEESRGKD